jgi:hypothetical protein
MSSKDGSQSVEHAMILLAHGGEAVLLLSWPYSGSHDNPSSVDTKLLIFASFVLITTSCDF